MVIRKKSPVSSCFAGLPGPGIPWDLEKRRGEVFNCSTMDCITPATKYIHRSLIGHENIVYDANFDKTGRTIVSASNDRTAKLWDVDSGFCISTLESDDGHKTGLTSASFSPDGSLLLTGSFDKTCKIWNKTTGECVHTLDKHDLPVFDTDWSPNGSQVVTGSNDKTAKVWNTATGEDVMTMVGHSGNITSVVWSPNGLQILTGSMDKTARVWDATKEGDAVLILKGHTEYVSSVVWSPNGSQIVTGSYDATAIIWDSQTGDMVTVLRREDRKDSSLGVSCVAYSGSRIVTGSKGGAIVVFSLLGDIILLLEAHRDVVNSVRFSNDGKSLLSSSKDKTVKIWETFCEPVKIIDAHEGTIYSAVFSRDSKRVITGSGDTTTKIWDAKTGDILKSLPGDSTDDSVFSADVSKDDVVISAYGLKAGIAKLWDWKSESIKATLKGHTSSISVVCFSNDGTMIVTGSKDQSKSRKDFSAYVKLWSADDGQLISSLVKGGHKWGVVSCAKFNLQDNRIITGCFDRTAKIWDITNKIFPTCLLTAKLSTPVYSVAFDIYTRRFVTGTEDGYIKVWDIASCEEIMTINMINNQKKKIVSVGFSPDGSMLLAASSSIVKLYDANRGRLIMDLSHENDNNDDDDCDLRVASWSPDGSKIVTGGKLQQIHIWYIYHHIAYTGLHLVTELDNAIVQYISNSSKFSLKGGVFETYPFLLHSEYLGRPLIDRIIESGDLKNIRIAAEIAPMCLLQPQKDYNTGTYFNMLRYFINNKNAKVCSYLVGVYNEVLLPPNSLMQSQRLLPQHMMAAQFTNGLPPCDIIDVNDLVILAKEYKELISLLIRNLVAVPNSRVVIGKWKQKLKHFLVQGSDEAYPISFWNSDENKSIKPDAIEFAVEVAILPLRNVACLQTDFLGAVFSAVKGDPMSFESEFLEILVDFKWNIYVRNVFMRDWILYATMTAAYTAHSLWFITYTRLPVGTIERNLGIILYTIVLFLHLYFVHHEVKQAAAEKGNTLYEILMNHLADPWNLQDLTRLSVVSSALIYYFVLLVKSSSNGGNIDPFDLRLVSTLSALSIPMFALGFLFYLQALSKYGALVRMVFKIIESIRSFLAVLIILIFGYSASFNLMTLTDYGSAAADADDTSWSTYPDSLLSSSLLVMGVDVSIEAIKDAHYAPIAVTLLVSFMFLMGVILLNLLIAIMSDKHGEVKKMERASANYNRAGIVVEYEKLIGKNHPYRDPTHDDYKLYSPKYLQVLRPERVTGEKEDGKEIQALEQLLHEKSNELKLENMNLQEQINQLHSKADEAKENNNQLKKLLLTQIESNKKIEEFMKQLSTLPNIPSTPCNVETGQLPVG